MASLLYSGLVNLISVMLNAWQRGRYPDLSEITYVLGLSFTEFFWYKPLMLFWRLEGFYRFFAKRSDWGVMERKGFTPDTQKSAKTDDEGTTTVTSGATS